MKLDEDVRTAMRVAVRSLRDGAAGLRWTASRDGDAPRREQALADAAAYEDAADVLDALQRADGGAAPPLPPGG